MNNPGYPWIQPETPRYRDFYPGRRQIIQDFDFEKTKKFYCISGHFRPTFKGGLKIV
jgi:hypothetical protein